MFRTFSKIRDLPLVAMTFVAATVATSASAADNAGNVGDVAKSLSDQVKNFGTLIGGASFVAGLAFVMMGLMRLKAAVDSQGQQVKYGEGIWRIVVGVGLAALPAVIKLGAGTFGIDESETLNFNNGFDS